MIIQNKKIRALVANLLPKICKEVITNYTATYIEIYSKGANQVEQVFYLTLLGDWISWYLSELRQVDAIEVNVINYLKGELAK